MAGLSRRKQKNAATHTSAAKSTYILFGAMLIFAVFQLMNVWSMVDDTAQLETILETSSETFDVGMTQPQPLSLTPPQAQTQIPPAVAANQSNARFNDKSGKAIANDTKYWADYRFGDYILSTSPKGATIVDFVSKYEGTLAVDYFHALNQTYPQLVSITKNGGFPKQNSFRAEVLCDMITKRGESLLPDALPRDTDLVIHLRLGDVLDNMIKDEEEVEDVFEYGVSIVPSQIRNMIQESDCLGWWHYVKSKCFYENVLSELISHAKPKPKRVIIVGSPVHKKNGTDNNSIKYSKLVEAFFVHKGYEVIRYLDGTPDEDMVWMSHSPVFVASGGGFSRLVTMCVNYFNSTALSSEQGWSKGLDKSCGEAPHPPIPKKKYSWEENTIWRGAGGAWDPRFRTFPPEEVIW
eukprot:CAMPEP_0181139058 /NCGR_PEP_ID=MMETSP1071-20121207/34584_1 /TAXON_ID=35127 /ORGANISM="Thalassiosira sp., Strain NH16" /LENGTH=407 /DNA_ID=CAMNT_0023225949 /DNA_START=350 /DNA_END=1570 /DNA_ORIENTATION=+